MPRFVQKVLMHVEIDGYFNVRPSSLDEIKVLFSLYQDADLFDQIVGSYINRIKEKLHDREDWYEMLTRLRAAPANIEQYNA